MICFGRQHNDGFRGAQDGFGRQQPELVGAQDGIGGQQAFLVGARDGFGVTFGPSMSVSCASFTWLI